MNETKDDVELRDHILMGEVPLIDTIFRYERHLGMLVLMLLLFVASCDYLLLYSYKLY